MHVKPWAARAAALALLAAPRIASADTPADKPACIAAYENGQRLQRDHALLEARAELLVCSRDPCPKAFQAECVGWLGEVDRAMPSVVLGARTPEGRDLVDVKVFVDARPFALRLDGKALEIDPGEHVFRFVPQRGQPLEQRVVIREGEKAREWTVVLREAAPGPAPTPAQATASPAGAASTEAGPPPAPSRPIPVVAYVLAGVGAVALGSFAYFGLSGRSEQSNTLDSCKPACSPSQRDDVLQKYIIADVSLGISVVALAAAAVVVLTRPSRPNPVSAFAVAPGFSF